jgi:hypothetical protein
MLSGPPLSAIAISASTFEPAVLASAADAGGTPAFNTNVTTAMLLNAANLLRFVVFDIFFYPLLNSSGAIGYSSPTPIRFDYPADRTPKHDFIQLNAWGVGSRIVHASAHIGIERKTYSV